MAKLKLRVLRERLFKLLFRKEFNSDEDMSLQCKLFFDEEELTEEEEAFIAGKYDRIIEHISKIDDIISKNATGWKLNRIGKVDLTILRLACYEILFDDEVPVSVAINEAVEIAKQYGQDESSAFVNAILGKISKTII